MPSFRFASCVLLGCFIFSGTMSSCGRQIEDDTTESNLPRFSVGGHVVGLGGIDPVVLADTGGNEITVATDGPFAFPTPIAKGSPFSVTVVRSPAALDCKVRGGSGQVANTPVTDVAISCTCIEGDVCVTLLLPEGAAADAAFVNLDIDFDPARTTTYQFPAPGETANIEVTEGRIVIPFNDVEAGRYYLYASAFQASTHGTAGPFSPVAGDHVGLFGYDLTCAQRRAPDFDLWAWAQKNPPNAVVKSSGRAAFDIQTDTCDGN